MKSEPLAVAVVGAGAEDPTAEVGWRKKKKMRSESEIEIEVGKRRERRFIMVLVCVWKILGWIGNCCLYRPGLYRLTSYCNFFSLFFVITCTFNFKPFYNCGYSTLQI